MKQIILMFTHIYSMMDNKTMSEVHYDTSVHMKSTLVFLSLLLFDLYFRNMVVSVFY